MSELDKNPVNANLCEFIRREDVICKQITAPTSGDSHKKHILDIVGKVDAEACSIDLSSADKLKNNWQAFVDRKETRICIVPWSLNKEWSLADVKY